MQGSRSNAVFLATCAALALIGIGRLALSERPPSAANEGTPLSRSPGFGPGDRVGDLVPKPVGDVALVLVLDSRCSICTASMPFLRELRALSDERGGSVPFHVLSRESTDEMRGYVAQHGLRVDSVRSVTRDAIKATGFPTLLAIDREGRVTGVWRGAMSEPTRQRIVKHLFDG